MNLPGSHAHLRRSLSLSRWLSLSLLGGGGRPRSRSRSRSLGAGAGGPGGGRSSLGLSLHTRPPFALGLLAGARQPSNRHAKGVVQVMGSCSRLQAAPGPAAAGLACPGTQVQVGYASQSRSTRSAAAYGSLQQHKAAVSIAAAGPGRMEGAASNAAQQPAVQASSPHCTSIASSDKHRLCPSCQPPTPWQQLNHPPALLFPTYTRGLSLHASRLRGRRQEVPGGWRESAPRSRGGWQAGGQGQAGCQALAGVLGLLGQPALPSFAAPEAPWPPVVVQDVTTAGLQKRFLNLGTGDLTHVRI